MSEVRRGCRADTLPVCAVKSVRVKGAAVAGAAAGCRWRMSCVESVCVTRALSWRRRRRRAHPHASHAMGGGDGVSGWRRPQCAPARGVPPQSRVVQHAREGGGRVAPKTPRPTRRPRVRLRTPRARGVGSRRRGWLKKIGGGEEDGALNGASARCTADSPAPSLRPPSPPPPPPSAASKSRPKARLPSDETSWSTRDRKSDVGAAGRPRSASSTSGAAARYQTATNTQKSVGVAKTLT